MPSQFDLLLDDLRRVQNERPPSRPFSKALPAGISAQGLAGIVHQIDLRERLSLRRMAADMRGLARDIAKRAAVDREKNSGATFFKSLGATRALVGKNLAAGKISPDDAIKAEAKLNRLFDRGVAIIAAEARS
jgi:hypothetical protein